MPAVEVYLVESTERPTGAGEATNPTVVHAVINTPGWTGDDTTDPGRTLLSEKHQGSLAEYVVVPKRNVLPKPADLSFGEAACLSTACQGRLRSEPATAVSLRSSPERRVQPRCTPSGPRVSAGRSRPRRT